ncbi:MAG: Lrp/AsnC family transcriptional regulator [Paramuribaculum sp.]|nr:Lrp/AsnC family transcriptional regulator [Paramuribaculum sp.]
MITDSLDSTDIAILRELQSDSRLTTKELAGKVHLSPTPVYERVRRLEQQGFIRRYVALLDAEKLGLGFEVFCMVKLASINRAMGEAFASRMLAIPHVTECYNVSGSFDYLLKVYAADMGCYRDFVLNELGALDNIASIESTFVMARLKHDHSVPLPIR